MKNCDQDITQDVGLDFISNSINCPLCGGEHAQIVGVEAFSGPQDASSDGVYMNMATGDTTLINRKDHQSFRPNLSIKLKFICQDSGCEFSLHFSENHGITSINVLDN